MLGIIAMSPCSRPLSSTQSMETPVLVQMYHPSPADNFGFHISMNPSMDPDTRYWTSRLNSVDWSSCWTWCQTWSAEKTRLGTSCPPAISWRPCLETSQSWCLVATGLDVVFFSELYQEQLNIKKHFKTYLAAALYFCSYVTLFWKHCKGSL